MTFGHIGGLNMMKRKKDLKRKAQISDKIEVNKDKIYRISDPIQLAEIFYPAKNAHQRRAAFLAIFFEIKNSRDQRLESTNHIDEEYKLSQSSINKARTKMSRLGLIRKREGYWIFSTAFANSLYRLISKIESFQMPALRSDERAKERFFVELTKGHGQFKTSTTS